MINIENLILGAGISGLACGQRLKELGKEYLVLEKRNTYGGLYDNFMIDDFRFNRFVHLSFTKDEQVRSFFDQTEYLSHTPNPQNYYHGIWIKHPAQNNLFPLNDNEKKKIIDDIKNREKHKDEYYDNYEKWLRYQFGDYFAECFPMTYTKKYWGVEAKDLETKWVGNRVYQPSMKEILEGMNSSETPITYYAKEMRYPKVGGFKKFLSTFSNEKNIKYHQEVIQIDTKNKIVYTADNAYHYEHLFSSIPLPEYKHLIKNISEDIVSNIEQLHWTSGYIVSLGMKGELVKKHLWDYIYDEDILPARLHSPSEKSPDNVPKGCCSLQAEVYFRDDMAPKTDMKSILEETICNLHKIGIIDRQSLAVKDIRFEKYANVIFNHNIYYTRDRVLSYLKSQNIIPIGRFGEWEYLWSDQSFISGYNSIKGTK